MCVGILTRYNTAEKDKRFSDKSLQINAKSRALALSMELLTDTVTVSTRRRIEPRTSRHSPFVCESRHD